MAYSNSNTEKLNKNIEEKHGVKLPQEVPNVLVQRGIVQSEDWHNLDNKTKLYILEVHIGKDWAEQLGLKEKKVEQKDIPQGVYKEEEKSQKEEFNVAEMQEDRKVREDFENLKKEIASEETKSRESVKKAEGGDSTIQASQGELSKVEKQRIEVEQGGRQSKIKFFGYQPSTQLVRASKKVSEDGEVEDASTWIATIIKKLLVSSDG